MCGFWNCSGQEYVKSAGKIASDRVNGPAERAGLELQGKLSVKRILIVVGIVVLVAGIVTLTVVKAQSGLL